MQDELKILFLEDNDDDVALIERTLRRSNFVFNSSHASNKDEFVSSLSSFGPDIILSDHSMPEFDSLSALKIVKEQCPQIPFILVTGSVSEEFAVKCIKGGAEDYVLKNNLLKLPSVIENALGKKELKIENATIKSLNAKLKSANEIIERKNKDTIDSINYAQRIQHAILPNEKLLCQYFPESFILFKPKDIVSGDFYWFAEHNGKFIIAVSDCTGHGVPGALLSMMGYHLLRNTVQLKGIVDPAGILNEINKGFSEIFEIGTNANAISDGMDISICSIDKANSVLTFSGAKRPLYIVRNKILSEIKGSPFPIGGSHHEAHYFKNEEVKMQKCDRFYMLTDGYADQFGGDDHKKLKSVGFKNLLMNYSTQPIHAQKNTLNDYFEMRRATEEQTDDVLVIGFEIE